MAKEVGADSARSLTRRTAPPMVALDGCSDIGRRPAAVVFRGAASNLPVSGQYSFSRPNGVAERGQASAAHLVAGAVPWLDGLARAAEWLEGPPTEDIEILWDQGLVRGLLKAAAGTAIVILTNDVSDPHALINSYIVPLLRRG